MKFRTNLAKRSKSFWAIAGFVLIGGVGILDFLTGYELAFSLFYLIPVSIVAWYAGQRLGIVAAVLSAFVWLVADVLAGSLYSSPFIYTWNTFIRFSFFVITVFLLANLRKALDSEKELARTDYLTGVVNSRFFYDLVQIENDRLQRHERPFTIAYIDLDNFKSLNDQFGHSVGDRVLHTVANSAKRSLRKTDVVARLGGDEFVLLLPETDEKSARVVLAKIHTCLLKEMRQSHWPITFSIGVLTCHAAPPTPDYLVRMADELMYTVKHEGKDAIRYSVYTG
ncbi:MAG: diguanylate cyclase [Candidatus Aminicenantes bacterium]|nr:diguanylate cyclase [Candidatus Aminicenantes bacterium]